MAGLLVGLAIRSELAKKKMKKLGAVSEETAKKPEELGIEQRLLKHDMAKIHGIRRTEDGRYYVECKDGKQC
ncbi:hypothetical protein MUP01_06720 [Candidatus Bathyarchaeota archaeon]|nr:hypothetical protein [Candidatus Bathyarchaeota archaeon]